MPAGGEDGKKIKNSGSGTGEMARQLTTVALAEDLD